MAVCIRCLHSCDNVDPCACCRTGPFQPGLRPDPTPPPYMFPGETPEAFRRRVGPLAGMPPELAPGDVGEAVLDMISAAIDPASNVLGDKQRACTNCGYMFRNDLSQCTRCHITQVDDPPAPAAEPTAPLESTEPTI